MFEVKFKPLMVGMKNRWKQISSKCENLQLNIESWIHTNTSQVHDIIKELAQSWKHQNCYKI